MNESQINNLIQQYAKYLNYQGQTLNRIDSILEKDNYDKRFLKCKNDFAKNYARHHFSQSDEDGLTIEINKRIIKGKKKKNTFLELGVGTGCENNTLILLAMGWEGSWFGGEELSFDHTISDRLKFQKIFISKENIKSIYEKSLLENKIDHHNLISIDLDGNDYEIASAILDLKANPDVFIVEYNAIFPPEIRWEMTYNEKHTWQGDSYFGASLASFVDLFKSYDYFLCACNPSTGANAFFVKNQYRDLFKDVPESINDIYMEPNYLVRGTNHWPISPKLVSSIIS